MSNSFWTAINNLEKETTELKKLVGVTNMEEDDKQQIFKWGNTVRSMMNKVGIDPKTQEDFNKFFKNFTEQLNWLISITEGVLPLFKIYYEEQTNSLF